MTPREAEAARLRYELIKYLRMKPSGLRKGLMRATAIVRVV